MQNQFEGYLAPPPSEDEIADNLAAQMRALGMSRTLNDQMRGLGMLSNAEKIALQRSGTGSTSQRL